MYIPTDIVHPVHDALCDVVFALLEADGNCQNMMLLLLPSSCMAF